jgi:hypothetical protein
MFRGPKGLSISRLHRIPRGVKYPWRRHVENWEIVLTFSLNSKVRIRPLLEVEGSALKAAIDFTPADKLVLTMNMFRSRMRLERSPPVPCVIEVGSQPHRSFPRIPWLFHDATSFSFYGSSINLSLLPPSFSAGGWNDDSTAMPFRRPRRPNRSGGIPRFILM